MIATLFPSAVSLFSQGADRIILLICSYLRALNGGVYFRTSTTQRNLAPDTTHSFLFGALAELIDNSRDAGATRLDVFSVDNEKLQGGFMLCFLDDGYGMSPEEASDVIFFGMSKKRIAASRFIGHYGNGLKSGSMRIGKDFILFTKKEETMTCIFLSQTFCESEGLDEVIVPMPSWSSETKESITDPKKFSEEISIIQKYSPFTTEAELMQQFDMIYRKSGTLVVIYNLKLMISGEPELDIKTNKEDILIAGVLEDFPERWSLRAYTSVLYFDPRMKIFIQAKRVQTKHLSYCLYRPRKYLYVTSSFKEASKNEVKKAEMAVKIAEQMVKEARFKINKSVQTGLSSAKEMLDKALEDAEVKQKVLKEKEKQLKKNRKLYLIFGMNIENRSQDGMFIYSNCRLIKMHEKVGPQLRPGSLLGAGVVGIVNIPLEVMEPSHNKQGFINIKEYNHLLRIMGLYLVQYWKDTGFSNRNPMLFWNEFGYQSNKLLEQPLNSAQNRRRQASEIPFIIQCDLCLKWRVLPSSDDYNRENLGNWTCANNPNLLENSCHSPEQLPTFPLGTMKPVSSSENEKEKQLRDSVQRYQNKLAEQQSQNSCLVPPKKTTEFLPSAQASAPKEYAKSRTVGPQRDALERDTYSSPVIWSSHLSQKRRMSRSDSTPVDVLENNIPETTVRKRVKVKQPRKRLEKTKINENSQVSSWEAERNPHKGFVEDSNNINEDEDNNSGPDLIMFSDESDAVVTLKHEKEEFMVDKGLVSVEDKPKLCADTPEMKENSLPRNLESLSTDDLSLFPDKKEVFMKEECDVAVPLVKPPQSTCVKETVEKLMAQLREILLYFHPQCKLSKDLDCMSMEELMATLELENCPEQLNKKLQMCCKEIWSVYMVQYEKKVRRKMQSITQEANKTAMNNEAHHKQCEKQIKITEDKLQSLRAKVATLLSNWNLSTPSDDLEHIDSYIEGLLNEENLFLPDTLKLVTRKSGQTLPSCEE
ncbi:MORC family CW-type zinc finger protein 1 [Dromiciops gliroides]|uniref:MORC family CW-type zinc finger protein 1 n=1 Tax=Dromiciops gliroides TaxID=33562 RepID=UPI001CC439B6|nr:MORC family CW-type zinc finger protein 1 [Dromiciops gliroides]